MVVICFRCKLPKSDTEFNKNRNNLNGLQTYCRDCSKIYNKAYNDSVEGRLAKNGHMRKYGKTEKGRHTKRKVWYKWRYGISIEDYDNILKTQNGKCAICDNVDSAGKRLAIDHCHKTGKIRGLLCAKCNQGLGLFSDSLNIVNKAVEYLEKYEP